MKLKIRGPVLIKAIVADMSLKLKKRGAFLLIKSLVAGIYPDAINQTNANQKDATVDKERHEKVLDSQLARGLPAIKAFIKSVQSKDKHRIAKFMRLPLLGAAHEQAFIKRFDLFLMII